MEADRPTVKGRSPGVAADCGGGTEILKGEAVLCLLGAANRDPAVIRAPRCDRRTLN
jgi:cytochrome P450